MNYRTIQADPHHDTQTAETFHAKALKIIERHLAGTGVDLSKAEQLVQEALVADVKYGPAHNTLGTLYLWQRKLYLAAWEFEYATKLMPEQVEPIYNLGMVYECAGKQDLAIEQYAKAYCLDRQNPFVIGSLARAKMRNHEEVDAVRPLLEELLFYDARPEWIAWACELLGLNPEEVDTTKKPATSERLPEIIGPGIVEETNQGVPIGDLPAPGSLQVPSAPTPPLFLEQ